ncbi:glutathione-regulated potassium-efflux system oxidoreductase KefF [Massilia horti]|uniref:NAD(P)H dehydrogenase n=1 Tax=Massilia horti TaxID=2562153 RepID=A0A4Y9T647_9BURK|nr:NAD(P)H-dependent oxidoreductase [Massilia horti]TFW32848.1 NAD(P)H dehydrogenase [Massilia horti]
MASGNGILVLYAHPAPQRSRANRLLAEAARDVPGVQVRDLYQTYPDFYIDAAHERKLVEASHLLVFMHPIRWYSMPSLLKEWLDVVFDARWAYERNEGALKGKSFWLVASTGSGIEAYRPGGLHGRPFADFLAPFEQTAALCGMRWIAPLILHGASGLDEDKLQAHVALFRERLSNYAASAPTAAD